MAPRAGVLLRVLLLTTGLARAETGVAGGLRPDRYCLSCLCTAATGCDVTTACQPDGGATICGPFYMSQPYWQDAKLTSSSRFSQIGFRQCASDVECAGEAVSSYMQRFSRDCDGDGRVTCLDFGLMHYMGYTSCGSPAGRQSKFFREFTTCAERMAGLLSREEYRPPAGHAPML